jgi:hypothetical protein
MRVVGVVLTAAGTLAAIVVPILGLPGAFPVLMGAALVLWFGGVATAAWCVAPQRLPSGLAALAAAILAWPLILVYGLAPLWGALAATSGLVLIVKSSGSRQHLRGSD